MKTHINFGNLTSANEGDRDCLPQSHEVRHDHSRLTEGEVVILVPATMLASRLQLLTTSWPGHDVPTLSTTGLLRAYGRQLNDISSCLGL